MKAEERRILALRAAVVEFGRRGYQATSTARIAERLGVSQPYLFRLFKSKKHIFVAAADWSLVELCRSLDDAADGRTGGEALAAMAAAYAEPSGGRRDLLRFELALYAAAGDPELSKVARRHFESLWSMVAGASRADVTAVSDFFGRISLMIIRALIDEPDALGECP